MTHALHRVTIPALAILAGVLLRLIGLDAWSLWGDEVASLNLASAPVPAILERASDLYPPLYSVFLHFWQQGGSGEGWLRGEAWIRLPSALAGIATIACVAWAAAQLEVPHRRTVALIAAALLALSPLHIWYSREARMYAFAALFATAGLGCYLGLLRQADFGSRRREDGEEREARGTRSSTGGSLRVLRASRSSEALRLRDPKPTVRAIAYVIFMLLGIYTAYASLLFWAAGLVVAPLLARALYGAPTLSRHYWLAQAAVALGFAPYLPVVVAQVSYGNFGFLAERVGLATGNATAAGSLGAALVLALLIICAIVALIAVAVSRRTSSDIRRTSSDIRRTSSDIRRTSTSNLQSAICNLQSTILAKPSFTHLQSVIIVALFALLTVLGAIPRGLSVKRQLLVFWPIAVLVAGIALAQLRPQTGPALLRGAASAALGLSLALSLAASAAMLAGGPFEDWRGAAGYVTATAPHVAVYLQSAWARDAFAHYYRGDGLLYAPGPARSGRPGTWDSQPPAITPSSAASGAVLVLNQHPALAHEVAPLSAWLAGRGEKPGSAQPFPRYLSVARVAPAGDVGSLQIED